MNLERVKSLLLRPHMCQQVLIKDDSDAEDNADGLNPGHENPCSIDHDSIPENELDPQVAWLDSNGLTAQELLGLKYEKDMAEASKSNWKFR